MVLSLSQYFIDSFGILYLVHLAIVNKLGINNFVYRQSICLPQVGTERCTINPL